MLLLSALEVDSFVIQPRIKSAPFATKDLASIKEQKQTRDVSLNEKKIKKGEKVKAEVDFGGLFKAGVCFYY